MMATIGDKERAMEFACATPLASPLGWRPRPLKDAHDWGDNYTIGIYLIRVGYGLRAGMKVPKLLGDFAIYLGFHPNEGFVVGIIDADRMLVSCEIFDSFAEMSQNWTAD